MSATESAPSRQIEAGSEERGARDALEAFWAGAAIAKLQAKFSLAREMEILPHVTIEGLRAICLQYRYSTQAFIDDLAVLVSRCPASRLRSLLGQLVNEELGEGDPERAHARLYDRFLISIGAIAPGTTERQLRAAMHPVVRDLIADLHDRTLNRSPLYAIGLRGLGGECVCGVYFAVMNEHLRQHPFVVDHDASIDWSFWEIHAGHADAEHNQLVRNAVAELLDDLNPIEQVEAVEELGRGYDHGTAAWDTFWAALYRDHGCQSA